MRRFAVFLVPIYVLLAGLAFAAGLLLSPILTPYLANFFVPIPPLGEAWTLTEQQFYGSLPPEEVRMRGAVRGMLETLEDPYTVLLDPQPAMQEQQRLSGSYGDIGVSLWWTPAGAVAVSPYPESPAELAGLQAGDQLIQIEDTLISDFSSLEEITWALQGEVGSSVNLVYSRPPTLTQQTLKIERADVLHPSVQYHMLDAERQIGYIAISTVTDQTANEISTSLSSMQETGLNALVLDLRGNGGGVVAPLPAMAGLFLPSGATLYHEIEKSEEQTIVANDNLSFTEALVVVVDKNTASAAEIFAAALQENERATIIGEITYGKGSMQLLYPLQDGSTLHVTNAIWLTPNRNKLDGVGIQPDILVDLIEGSWDAAMELALEFLYETMAQ